MVGSCWSFQYYEPLKIILLLFLKEYSEGITFRALLQYLYLTLTRGFLTFEYCISMGILC
jgi:hypothetical protein